MRLPLSYKPLLGVERKGMRISTAELLGVARSHRCAVGAFNIYNLEGVKAVIEAAEAVRSPVILQIHPAALEFGRRPLVALCVTAADQAVVPVSVHLDHCSSAEAIGIALEDGIRSIMADGSHLDYQANCAFTREQTMRIHAQGGVVEAELGRISGSEDGMSVSEREARMTDPALAADYVAQTGVDMLAVCIGNVHGRYAGAIRFDFQRLAAIREAVPVPLVLHGTSGVPDDLVRRCIELSVSKFNVNTEVREAYLAALRQPQRDLLNVMTGAVDAMQAVIRDKLRLFNSVGLADTFSPQ